MNGTELHELNAVQQHHHHQRAEREKGHKLLSGVHSLVDDLPPDIVAKRTEEDAIEKAFGFCNSRICGRAFVVWTSDNGNHKRIVYRAFFMAPSSSVHRRIFLPHPHPPPTSYPVTVSESTERVPLLINLPKS